MKPLASVAIGIVIWLLLVAGTLSFEPRTASSSNGEAFPATTPTPEVPGTRKVSEPYTGDLAIFEDPNRAANLQIDRVMDLLKIGPGKAVADIGAGSGWFTVRAARRAAPGGRVYAVEINQQYLDHISKRASAEKLENVIPLLGKPDDPRLPGGQIDAVLILKTYHEIAEPVTLMRHLRTAMRPGGLVGIIDRNGEGDDHGLNGRTVVDELKSAGFEKVSEYDFVKADGMDYFLVFKPAESKSATKKK